MRVNIRLGFLMLDIIQVCHPDIARILVSIVLEPNKKKRNIRLVFFTLSK